LAVPGDDIFTAQPVLHRHDDCVGKVPCEAPGSFFDGRRLGSYDNQIDLAKLRGIRACLDGCLESRLPAYAKSVAIENRLVLFAANQNPGVHDRAEMAGEKAADCPCAYDANGANFRHDGSTTDIVERQAA
jgi:hypothetical protein